jgi:hypothetical protein
MPLPGESMPEPTVGLTPPCEEAYGKVLAWSLSPRASRDLRALERILTDSLTADWIKIRLSSDEPPFPADQDSFESPDQLFIDLWLAAAPEDRVRVLLGDACVLLLTKCRSNPPEPWEGRLLTLVSAIRPERCKALLLEIATTGEFDSKRIEANLDLEWASAAASYDSQPPWVYATWARLIDDPRYSSIAYRALAHDSELGIWHLPRYWESMSIRERAIMLPEALRLVLEHGVSKSMDLLRIYRSHLSAAPGLYQAIDRALREMSLPGATDLAAHDNGGDGEAKKGGKDTSRYANIGVKQPSKTRIAA